MNIKKLKVNAAAVAVALTLSSTGLVISTPAYAMEGETNDATIEQTIEQEAQEEVKEEIKEEVEEEAKVEVKEEAKEESQEEVEEEVVEKTEEEVKEEVKEDETEKTEEEVTEEVKEETVEQKVECKEEENTTKADEKTSTTLSSGNEQNTKATTSQQSEVHKVQTTTSKLDEDGVPLAGALLQIIDSEGNVVDEWISDGTDHISMLPEGDYILHEVAAPNGYIKAADKSFTIKVEVKDLNAGVDFSETPCEHYGGTPLYYIEMESQKSEVYCINQDWETPDENSIYDGMVLGADDIRNFMQQTVYVDSHENTNKIDVSDQSLDTQQLYDKILDIIYHRERAVELFDDLTPAEIRYITESALKNYTNAGLTRVQRVNIGSVPTGYDKYDYYETDDGRYVWYLYPWYRSFVYNPNAPLGTDIFTTVIGEGDAFGTLARHWSSGHNAKSDEEIRTKIARYYELYQYLISDTDHHPEDMHLYIYSTANTATDTSSFDFDNGAYQNLLGITWFNPYDENYAIDLDLINLKETEPPVTPDEPPIEPPTPDVPVVPDKPDVPVTPVNHTTSAKVSTSPQTGDETNIMVPLMTGIGSTITLLGLALKRRKEKVKVK